MHLICSLLRSIKTMNILESFKLLKIDFTNTIIKSSGGIEPQKKFDLLPRDFLRFAKKDYRETTDAERGLINALTNAKRAIDCQIDNAFSIYGINYSKILRASEKIILASGSIATDVPHKLKLVEALSLAPSGLISKTRTLRNKLEHYYERPLEKDIKEALELAELFILSLESHLKLIDNVIIIYDKSIEDNTMRQPTQINLKFNIELGQFEGIVVDRNKVIGRKCIFSEKDEDYYGLLKLMNSLHDEQDCQYALKSLLRVIGHPIPSEKIKLHKLIKA